MYLYYLTFRIFSSQITYFHAMTSLFSGAYVLRSSIIYNTQQRAAENSIPQQYTKCVLIMR